MRTSNSTSLYFKSGQTEATECRHCNLQLQVLQFREDREPEKSRHLIEANLKHCHPAGLVYSWPSAVILKIDFIVTCA